MQPVEVAQAIGPQDHALAVEHERGGAQPASSLKDHREAAVKS
jgi:hypothetical protein